jgi:hypothetical protein
MLKLLVQHAASGEWASICGSSDRGHSGFAYGSLPALLVGSFSLFNYSLSHRMASGSVLDISRA